MIPQISTKNTGSTNAASTAVVPRRRGLRRRVGRWGGRADMGRLCGVSRAVTPLGIESRGGAGEQGGISRVRSVVRLAGVRLPNLYWQPYVTIRPVRKKSAKNLRDATSPPADALNADTQRRLCGAQGDARRHTSAYK